MRRLWPLLALLLAVPSWAGNATTVDSVCAFSGFRDIGITAYFHGDDDSNNVFVGLFRKHGVSGWDTLMFFRSTTMWPIGDVTPLQTRRNRRFWAASAMMLSANETYDFRWQFSDAGGVVGKSGGDTTFTVAREIQSGEPTLRCTGTQYFIGPFGSDSNNGLSAAAPLLTFPAAIAKMTGLGDQLVVLGGGTIYTMRSDTISVPLASKNGDGRHYYSIVGRPGATISGADTTALAGAGWGTKAIGNGVTCNVFGFSSKIYPREVVVDDTLRLYPYHSFYEFQTDAYNLASLCGCFWCSPGGDSVFIRVPSPLTTALTGHTIEVPRRNSICDIRSAFWLLDSLIVRASGVGHDVGISSPVVNLSGQGCVVEHCRFMDLGRPAIGFRNRFDQSTLTHGWCTVQYDSFLTHTLGTAWNGQYSGQGAYASKYVGYDNMALKGCIDNSGAAGLDTTCLESDIVFPTMILEGCRGHTVRWNYALGGNDSFVRTTDIPYDTTYATADTAQDATNDMSVYGNFVINMGDDVFEPDGMVGRNSRIYKNVVLSGHTGMNWDCVRGPFYYIFNTFIHGGAFLPNGEGSEGPMRGQLIFANNTIFSDRNNSASAWADPQAVTQNGYVNIHVWNNLLGALSNTFHEDGTLGKNDINWNVHEHTADTNFVALTNYSSQRTLTTLKAWRDSTYGYGANDAYTNSIMLGDSLHWDWSPKSTWTGVVGRGCARSIPGVNTNVKNHIDPFWKINPSGSSDSTYVGAWPPNGMLLEAVVGTKVIGADGYPLGFVH